MSYGVTYSADQFQGQQREIFVLWFYSSIDPSWTPVYCTTFFSNSVLNSLSYSKLKFVLHNEPLRGTNFFCRYQRFITWVVQALLQNCLYTYTFQHHCPFIGYGKLIKTVVQFCAMVIDFTQWPIAHSQMPRHGTQRLTKSFAMAHSGKSNPALRPIAHNQILHYSLQRKNHHRFYCMTSFRAAAHSA